MVYVNQSEVVWAVVEYDTVGKKFAVVPITSGESSAVSEVEKEKATNLKAENKEKKDKEEKGSDTKPEK